MLGAQSCEQSGDDDETKAYLRQLDQTRALIQNYLTRGVYRLLISTFEQAQRPAEATRPALAAAGAQSLLKSLRRELQEDAFCYLDLAEVFPGQLEILAMEPARSLPNS